MLIVVAVHQHTKKLISLLLCVKSLTYHNSANTISNDYPSNIEIRFSYLHNISVEDLLLPKLGVKQLLHMYKSIILLPKMFADVWNKQNDLFTVKSQVAKRKECSIILLYPKVTWDGRKSIERDIDNWISISWFNNEYFFI